MPIVANRRKAEYQFYTLNVKTLRKYLTCDFYKIMGLNLTALFLVFKFKLRFSWKATYSIAGQDFADKQRHSAKEQCRRQRIGHKSYARLRASYSF